MKEKILKQGEIAIKKNAAIECCQCIHEGLNALDKIMLSPPSPDRGKRVAAIANKINIALHAFEHFELGIPLNKLGNKFPQQ